MKAWLHAGQPDKALRLDALGLTSLPEPLPASLKRLVASNNRLISLPEHLPDSLNQLDVSGNRLRSLPVNITTMRGNCNIDLNDNLLSLRIRNHLRRTMRAANYCGPHFHFSRKKASRRPLEKAVWDWYDDGEEEVKATWSVFTHEEGAAEFSRFLDRLRDTVNYENPAFRQSVQEWLFHLSGHPQLRKDTFASSLGATTSCEDRVSLVYNDMKKIRLASDVENGYYDDRLKELIDAARGMYRLDQLEKITWETVTRLRLLAQSEGKDADEEVDNIEVYLAYQVKLRDRLQLPLDTADMDYFSESRLTGNDLSQAEQRVKESENEEFVSYLSAQWQPWQAVLSRFHGTQYEQAQDQLIEATGDIFQARLAATLQSIGLENDDDARRIVGPKVMADIEHEIKESLTREFLHTHNLSDSLDPQWYFDALRN